MRLLVLCLLSSLAHATSIFEPVKLFTDQCTIVSCVPIVLTPDINPLISPARDVNTGHGGKFIAISYRGFEADTDALGILSIAGRGEFIDSHHINTINSCFPRPPSGCQIITFFDWYVPLNIYTPHQATIQFSYGGIESDTYRFQIVEPVPEPSSLFLAVSGLLGLGGLRIFRPGRQSRTRTSSEDSVHP